MHHEGEKLGENWRRSGRILTPNERVLTLGVKLSENFDRKRGDRQKDRHTDASDFIICPMLCYSNGTSYSKTYPEDLQNSTISLSPSH